MKVPEKIKITIDPDAGFCFGVVRAIKAVDNELDEYKELFCLGDIVHNSEEISRLEKRGLKIIDHIEFRNLKNQKVIIRAHGEPLSTYEIAKNNNIEIIDASCPIVLKLQELIRNKYEKNKGSELQIVIFGKAEHPEIIGLNGQTENSAIIIESENDIDKIDFKKPIMLFSQTTSNIEGFDNIVREITKKKEIQKSSDSDFEIFDTICRKVSNRSKQIIKFAKSNDIVIFVSDKKSSNGKYLFNLCKSVNNNSYFISDKSQIRNKWFANITSIGVSGATSTPGWLMEDVSKQISEMFG